MGKKSFESDNRTEGRKLSLKQRIIILSRRAVMRSPRARLLEAGILTAVLFAVLLAAGTTGWLTGHAAALPTPKGEGQLQFTFVGDMNLGRYAREYGEEKGYAPLFEAAKELWSNSDAVFANLECAVADAPEELADNGKQSRFAAASEAVTAAAEAGINVVSLANDHTMDYGEEGMLQTIQALQAAGITYAGAGMQNRDAAAFQLVDCGIGTVALVAFSDCVPEGFGAGPHRSGIATASASDLYRNVRIASDLADLCVVYVHWGRENKLLTGSRQQRLAHQLVESGADVVIGTHPHVLQTVEQYRNGVIFYSVGNFITDQGTMDVRNSVMVQLNYDRATDVGEFTLIPLRINELCPQATENAITAGQIRRDLTRKLEDGVCTVTEDGRIHMTVDFSGNEKG